MRAQGVLLLPIALPRYLGPQDRHSGQHIHAFARSFSPRTVIGGAIASNRLQDAVGLSRLDRVCLAKLGHLQRLTSE